MKKKRVETFRNIRYGVRGHDIYKHIYRKIVPVVRLGGLAPARPINKNGQSNIITRKKFYMYPKTNTQKTNRPMQQNVITKNKPNSRKIYI